MTGNAVCVHVSHIAYFIVPPKLTARTPVTMVMAMGDGNVKIDLKHTEAEIAAQIGSAYKVGGV